MGILDITDNYTKNLITNEFEPQNVDQYINGVKEHTQPLVTFTSDGDNVIYREQL